MNTLCETVPSRDAFRATPSDHAFVLTRPTQSPSGPRRRILEGPRLRTTFAYEDAGNETVNGAVRDHQLRAIEWDDRGLAESLYRMADILATSLFSNESPGSVLICPARTGCRRSRYRAERDGMGIRHVIEFNVAWIEQFDDFQRLAALAYEMVHAWQASYGKPPRDGRIHNREFIDKARAIGLHVGERRHGIQGVGGPFLLACRAAGIEALTNPAERLPLPAPAAKGGNTRMKWSCGCQEAQVGCKVFEVTCDRCGQKFQPVTSSSPVQGEKQ